jgi:hypothetical protein
MTHSHWLGNRFVRWLDTPSFATEPNPHGSESEHTLALPCTTALAEKAASENRLLPVWSQLNRKVNTKLGNCVFVVEQCGLFVISLMNNHGFPVCFMIPRDYSL